MTIQSLPAASPTIGNVVGGEVEARDSSFDPWPPDPRERRDFCHRIRAFPPEVARWRDQLVNALLEDRLSLPGVSLPADRDRLRALVDDGISHVREIARILALLYGRPSEERHGAALDDRAAELEALRVLTRLGPYGELGLDLRRATPRRRSTLLVGLMPPNLRGFLFPTLAVHGRSICLASQPECERCELRNFCATYRTEEADRAARLFSLTAVDLFCGAGGLSEGFRRAGFYPVVAVDQDPVALRTYRLNHPGLPEQGLICRDVRELGLSELRRRAGGPVNVLLGAPPCQGFSHVGFRSKPRPTGYRLHADERNLLPEYLVAAAIELRPQLVVMENVPGMQSARQEQRPDRAGLRYLEAVAQQLEKRAGFQATIWRLNACAYGVPQDRVRYFLVARRNGRPPDLPPADYQDPSSRNFDPDALPPITFNEAVFDLPARAADSGSVVARWESIASPSDVRYRRYLRKFGLLRQSPLLYNHTARYQNARDLELYALLKPGENSITVLERTGRHDLMCYRRDVFDDKYARLRPDRPSKTIVAHLAKDGNGYIHPSQVRSITIREAARLQSFHDGYVFCGSPSDQWVQIGNAVPPLLAEAIARACLLALQRGVRR